MSLPKPITFSYSYTGFQQSQGNNSFPGTRLDADMAEIKQSVNDVVSFLENIFQPDGKLKAEFLPGASIFEGLKDSIHAEVGTATAAAVASFNSSLAANVAAAIPNNLVVNSVRFTPQTVVPGNLDVGSTYFDLLSGNLKVYNGTTANPVDTGTGTPVTPGGSTGGGGGNPAPSAPTSITLSGNSILENSPAGTVVGVLAADQSGVTFSLVSGDTTYFTIVGNELRASGIFLDFEASATRNLTIRATNTANLTFDKAFTINVGDVIEGGGGGTALIGVPDAVGPISTIGHDIATAANTGYRFTLQPATNITTNSTSPVYRSGTTIRMQGTAPVLEKYDLRGYDVLLLTDNCTVRDCLFNCGGTFTTIYAQTTKNHIIEYNECNGATGNTSTHGQFIFLEGRVPQKSIYRNKVINMPADGITVGGSVERFSWNYFNKLGLRTGAHPDCITINAGFPNQPRSNIAYNWLDEFGDGSGIVSSNAGIKIADNADLRSNYLIYRSALKGGSYQTQIDLTKASKINFHECKFYILNGAPVYLPLGTGSDVAMDGPYGAFDVYGLSGDIIISGAIEARDGQPAYELAGGNPPASAQRGSQKVYRAGATGPVVVNSISSSGAISIQPASGAVSYQYIISVAGTGEFGVEQPLTLTGTNPLTGTITPIPNAYNHVLVRGLDASGRPGEWSATAEFSSAAAATPTAPTLSGVTISGTPTQGQQLTATPGTATGSPSPTITYQWQRDTAGNATYTNISGATGNTYTLTSADAGNKVRVVATANNGVGSAAVANSSATALIGAASANITFRSVGTMGKSVEGGSGALTATGVTKPAGTAVGDLLIRLVQYSGATQLTTPTGWTKLAAEDFFGIGGGAVYWRVADGTSGDTPVAMTVGADQSRGGDFLTDVVLAYTGGSAAVGAFATNRATDVTNTTVTAPNLTATGPNRRQLTAWFTEFNSDPATSVSGSPPTGFTERFEATDTTPGTYMQTVALDESNGLFAAGAVTGETRTFSSGPRVVVAISFLIY